MKIRNDFVTNSSSSSFVIAYKEPEIDAETRQKYPFIQALLYRVGDLLSLSSGYETDEGDVVKSILNLDKYFIQNYAWSNDARTINDVLEQSERLEEMYESAKRKINDGYMIMFKEVDYNDDVVRDLLETLSDTGLIHIVEKD